MAALDVRTHRPAMPLPCRTSTPLLMPSPWSSGGGILPSRLWAWPSVTVCSARAASSVWSNSVGPNGCPYGSCMRAIFGISSRSLPGHCRENEPHTGTCVIQCWRFVSSLISLHSCVRSAIPTPNAYHYPVGLQCCMSVTNPWTSRSIQRRREWQTIGR